MLEPVAFESFLERRYARSTAKRADISYAVTQDAGLIHQYQLLREEMFINLMGERRPQVQCDMYDGMSSFVVASRGRQCLAGCRITLREPDADHLLPVESGDFALSGHLRKLPIDSVRIAEISRTAAVPDDEEGFLVQGIMQAAIAWLRTKKVRFAFMEADVKTGRHYAAAAEAQGFDCRVVASRAGFQLLYMLDMDMAYKNNNIKQYIKEESLSA